MDLTGKKLGVYEIREPLGQGGMGAVYKAYDPTLDRFVAVKVLPAALAADESYVARFQHEAKALAKLQHPNLIHIYSVGEQDGVNYFAMELLSGVSLQAVIAQKGRLPVNTAIQILGQVMAGLHKAHEVGMVHRDIKPANIMLQEEAGGHRAVLMDFGLAKENIAQGLTQEGTIIGTPEYMSPEQAQGEGVDHRSDIYALGVVLYEMLVGEPPFKGATSFQILRQHVEDPPPPLRQAAPHAPEALEAIVAKMLAKKPKDRYQNLLELAVALLPLRRTPALLTLARLAQRRGAVDPDVVTSAMSAVTQPTIASRGPAAPRPEPPPTEPASVLKRTWDRAQPWSALIAGAAVVTLVAVWLVLRSGGEPELSAAKPAGESGAAAASSEPAAPSASTSEASAPRRPEPPARPPAGAPTQRLVAENGRLARKPAFAAAGVQAEVTTSDGRSIRGELVGFDSAAGEVILKTAQGRRRVDFDKVKEILLPPNK